VLGGEGIIVEIDEAKFGKRKYNRGRLIEGQWCFGGLERGTKKTFFVPVERRDKYTLLECIKKWIKPGTTIYSDCWKAYDCLDDEGYIHHTVNHSVEFVCFTKGDTYKQYRKDLERYPSVDHTVRQKEIYVGRIFGSNTIT
jgi:transposase-like protein